MNAFLSAVPAEPFRWKNCRMGLCFDDLPDALYARCLGSFFRAGGGRKHHSIDNVTVVFAPRAGRHSSIAEKAALFLRDQELSRMSIVEQKCAEDIPRHVDGERHYERE